MTITVDPDNTKNTHHLRMYKGAEEVGLILCDGRGNPSYNIHRTPYPRTAIKMYEQEGEYNDMQPPFKTLAQSTWRKGLGRIWWEDDSEAYYLSEGLDTTRDGRLILGGRWTFGKGYRNQELQTLGGIYYLYDGLYALGKRIAMVFTASATYTLKTLELVLQKILTAGIANQNLEIGIWSASSGLPHTEIGTLSVTASSLSTKATRVKIPITFAMNLTSGNEYAITIKTVHGGGVDLPKGNIAVLMDNSRVSGLYESTPSNWSTLTAGDFWFRAYGTAGDQAAHFFEYKNQLYFATQPLDGTAGKLYMNGYRGACDSNAGNLTFIKDSTQTGWASPFGYGMRAVLIDGTERVNWRTIEELTSGNCEVSDAWDAEHTTNNNYVIVNSDLFTQITGTGSTELTKPVTDVAVANDIMYLAQGESDNVILHREYNNAGTWRNADNGADLAWLDGGQKAWLLEVREDATSGDILAMVQRNEMFGGVIDREIARRHWSPKLLDGVYLAGAGTAWNEQVIGSVTSTWEGDRVGKIAVASGFTTGTLASKAVTSRDVTPFTKIGFWAMTTIGFAAGDLQLLLDNSANCASATLTIDLPALKANTWTRVELTYSTVLTDAQAIISVGFNLVTDVGAFDLYTFGPVVLYNNYDPVEIPGLPTGIISYGSDEEEFWILTDEKIGKISDNDVFTPALIYGLETARSIDNGRAACAHNRYLYFSLGSQGGVQRYYDGVLDDIGLDVNDGLPFKRAAGTRDTANRRGPIVKLLAYEDRVIAAVDAGEYGYSGIYGYKGGGWHEMYTAPFGVRIWDAYIQKIPGLDYAKLWISEGADVLWIPVCTDPLDVDEYPFIWSGWIETGRISNGTKNIDKYWDRVDVPADELSADKTVQVEYTTDDVTYSVAGTITSGSDTDLLLTNTADVTSKWIKYRLTLEKGAVSDTPIVRGLLTDLIQTYPTKPAYVITFRLADLDTQLDGMTDGVSAKTKLDTLDDWTNEAGPIYVESVSSLEDGMVVKLQPTGVNIIGRYRDKSNREVRIGQMTVLKIR